jgi:hypothetical protein
MPASPDSRSRRRFLRLGVRWLIVVVLAIGAGLGWTVRSAHVQREAVAAIQEAGGMVYYDVRWSSGKNVPAGEPWAPRWLVKLIGVDYFGRVTVVWFPGHTDLEVLPVGRLTGLERLNLGDSTVSDAGIAHLNGLSDLCLLFLQRTKVTDAGLSHLRRLTQLEWLDLSHTRVTDAGLAHLEPMTRLTRLNLEDTPVTDAGLSHLRRLTSLEALYVRSTQVTDAGVRDLERALPSLTIIH